MEPQQPQTSPAKESRSWGPRPDPPCLSSQSGHAYTANLRIFLFSLPSILGEHLLVPPWEKGAERPVQWDLKV